MAFYTNILRYKNFILHRGYYDNGERFARKEYFQPKLFVSSKMKTEWTGLDGNPVAPLDFESMYEAGQWLKQNIDVSGRNIYGNKKFTQQFVTERYPRDIEFRRDFINVGTIDYVKELGGSYLKVINPNATASCGCGESFAV